MNSRPLALAATALAVFSLVLAGILWADLRDLRGRLEATAPSSSSPADFWEEAPESAAPASQGRTSAEQEEIEIGEIMLVLQIRLEKLYQAGSVGNRRLAGFYLEEIEETSAELYGVELLENGVNIGAVMESLMPGEIENMEEALGDGEKAFERAFQRLIGACNSCHVSSGHAYLRIQRPEQPLLTSQRYR